MGGIGLKVYGTQCQTSQKKSSSDNQGKTFQDKESDVTVHFICNFKATKTADDLRFVEGSFTFKQSSLTDNLKERSIQHVIELLLNSWLESHFNFSYTAICKGDSFHGTFRSDEHESRNKIKESRPQNNENKKPSNS